MQKPWLGAALAFILLSSLFFWIYAAQSESYLQQRRLQIVSELEDLGTGVSIYLNGKTSLNQALKAFVMMDPEISQVRFFELANEVLRPEEGVRSLQLAKGGTISHLYPRSEGVMGLNLLRLPGQNKAVKLTIDKGETILAGPIELVQGGQAFALRSPIYMVEGPGPTRENFWGFATTLIDYKWFLKSTNLKNRKDLELAIMGSNARGAEGGLFCGQPYVFEQDPVLLEVPVPGGSWLMAAIPKGGWSSMPAQAYRLIILGVVITLSGTACMYCQLRRISRLRRRVEELEAGC